ncbi:DNA/RNA non-specific endonuclease, partial [Lysinibacillus telephonicus]
LLETANDHVTVKLERDASGQVIKEWQNDHWIESSYDELGNRFQITSSLGANITVARNEMGNVTQMTASHSDQAQWTASMQYNELGQEIERILPGDVISKWQYDISGRPTHHRVRSQNRDTRRRVYNWDVNHRLRSMVNELTGVKVTYGYDEFSNLVWSNQGGQFDFLYRSVDDVGNLYETREKSDRVYGPGSRLLETKDANFSYDEEGNLIEKVENNGDTWKYEYYGNGMLSKVIKPDKTEVTFKYDTLGRRVEKSSNEKSMRFVWDGNTILHEFDSQKDSAEPDLVTWVFNDGFVPSAKITSEGHYSIISDYLGTPVEAYDDEGNKVWSADLDVYGRVKEFTGEKDFIPFRYQGQYEDQETGLYYNRFRYYDPEQGNYTQIDPIGLAGNNPTLYGYVSDPNIWLDLFGLNSTGGHIIYGELDHLGRPTGVSATITSDMIGTGSPASFHIRPPGFGGQKSGHARGHLLAKILGGSGKDSRNLVTLIHNPVNSPVMRDFELAVRDIVKNGQTVSYRAVPIYDGSDLMPRGVTLSAKGTGGFSLDVTIVNRKYSCKK